MTFAVALASFGRETAAHPMLVPLGVFAGSAGWYGGLSLVAQALRERVRDRMDRVGMASALFLAACALLSAILAVRAW